ncbi:MAG TPA: sugar nucleotide-binding protein [Candidatus Methanoperedens sp.]|nr:sugar nucleotide-binding protein [Candidatus Methanoperedens sp.]
MKILIIGASSYVGARIYFDLYREFDVIGTYNSSQLSKSFIKLDITDKIDVETVLKREKPDYVIDVAASANSRWCESNQNEAVLLNEKSTQYIVHAANKINSKIIYISSFVAFNPDNIYGKTKYNSEQIVKKTKSAWVILRPSLILGFSPNTKNDRPFNRLLKNLDEGTPAEYDTSWKFQPTYLGHLSEVIREVIKKDITNQLIPVAVEELKSRFDTANDILSPFNIEVTPIDGQDKIHFSEKKDLSKLTELNLPTYEYKQMIGKIVDEIKNRQEFSIDF